jgi:hypothetical protein
MGPALVARRSAVPGIVEVMSFAASTTRNSGVLISYCQWLTGLFKSHPELAPLFSAHIFPVTTIQIPPSPGTTPLIKGETKQSDIIPTSLGTTFQQLVNSEREKDATGVRPISTFIAALAADNVDVITGWVGVSTSSETNVAHPSTGSIFSHF